MSTCAGSSVVERLGIGNRSDILELLEDGVALKRAHKTWHKAGRPQNRDKMDKIIRSIKMRLDDEAYAWFVSALHNTSIQELRQAVEESKEVKS